MKMTAPMRERLDYVLEKCFDEIRSGNDNYRMTRNDMSLHDDYEYERKPRRNRRFHNSVNYTAIFGSPYEEVQEDDDEVFQTYRICFYGTNLKEEGVVEMNKRYIVVNGMESTRFEAPEVYEEYAAQLEEMFSSYEIMKANRAFNSVLKIMGYDRQYKIEQASND